MATMKTVESSLLFLIIFSIGCIAGMMIAAAVLGLPFSKKFRSFIRVQQILVFFYFIIFVIIGARIIVGSWFS